MQTYITKNWIKAGLKSIQNVKIPAKKSQHIFIAEKAFSNGGIGRYQIFGYSLWSISDPILLRKLLVDSDSNLKKGNLLHLLKRIFGQSLFSAEGAEWERLSYSSKSTLGKTNSEIYHKRIVQVVEKWVRTSMPTSENSFILNLREDLYFLNMDIMSAVLLGCLLPETSKRRIYAEHDWIKATINTRLASSLVLPTWIPSPFDLLILFRRQRINHLLLPWVVKAKRMTNEFGNCLISDLDSEIRGKSLCPFSRMQHADFVKTLFFAGIRTSAVTLEWIILYLMSRPQDYGKIQYEIDRNIGTEELTSFNIAKLVYMNKFVNEVMRIAPVGHTHARQVKSSFKHEMNSFRTGDIILLSIYGLHHDPNVWNEPEKFNPNRFNEKQLASSFLPYGLGQHTCPGQHLSNQTIAIALVTFLRNFNIKATGQIDLEAASHILLEPSTKQSVELVAR